MTFTTAGRTVTEADLVAFSGIAGGFNPLHTARRSSSVTRCTW